MCRRNIFACPGSFPDSFADQPHPDSLRKLCQPVRIQFHIFLSPEINFSPGKPSLLPDNLLPAAAVPSPSAYAVPPADSSLSVPEAPSFASGFCCRTRWHWYCPYNIPAPAPPEIVRSVPCCTAKGTDIDFPVCSCPLWTHPAQSIQSASPDQLKQHGLRIVFHMMRQCDPDVSVLPGCIRKHLISQNSCRLFFSQMMYFGITWNINIPDMTDNPPLFTELFHKHRIILLSSPRIPCSTWITSSENSFRGKFIQNQAQTDRVRTAGHSNEYPASPRHHIPLSHKFSTCTIIISPRFRLPLLSYHPVHVLL